MRLWTTESVPPVQAGLRTWMHVSWRNALLINPRVSPDAGRGAWLGARAAHGLVFKNLSSRFQGGSGQGFYTLLSGMNVSLSLHGHSLIRFACVIIYNKENIQQQH
ncbi:hypothetical protein KIL84_005321 [Mauremys mutica]|uniref:Uncharacterized protein n=1 Tax=Mauremys mutica TaxID=74926 RepID=A0A9D3XM40_9SAUR|nr:hypothetical protein KIL84_005321 [Mauremys mutica]